MKWGHGRRIAKGETWKVWETEAREKCEKPEGYFREDREEEMPRGDPCQIEK